MTDHTDIVERLNGFQSAAAQSWAHEAAAEINRLRAEAEALRKDKTQLLEALQFLMDGPTDYQSVIEAIRKARAAIDATKGTT